MQSLLGYWFWKLTVNLRYIFLRSKISKLLCCIISVKLKYLTLLPKCSEVSINMDKRNFRFLIVNSTNRLWHGSNSLKYRVVRHFRLWKLKINFHGKSALIFFEDRLRQMSRATVFFVFLLCLKVTLNLKLYRSLIVFQIAPWMGPSCWEI